MYYTIKGFGEIKLSFFDVGFKGLGKTSDRVVFNVHRKVVLVGSRCLNLASIK